MLNIKKPLISEAFKTVPENGNLSKIIIKDMELIERFIYAFMK